MSQYLQIGGLILIFVIMYMVMIRPQRKREKQVNEMRSALKTGDEIITIGGIKGRIVNTHDDSVTISVGADKVKFEIMRWGVSKVDVAAPTAAKSSAKAEITEDKPAKKEIPEEKPARKPRKLGAVKSDSDGEE